MKEEILKFIRSNRVSSTQVADALQKKGVLKDIMPLNTNHHKTGEVFYIWGANETNWDIHLGAENAPENSVVFIDIIDNKIEKASFGDLISKYLIIYKQVASIITNGKVRDAPKLIKENWPIWCIGRSPIGFNNNKEVVTKAIEEKIKERKEFFHGSIAVCDDTGVVIIPKNKHNHSFLNDLIAIEEKEDRWLECIDRKKLSTFQTVCIREKNL